MQERPQLPHLLAPARLNPAANPLKARPAHADGQDAGRRPREPETAHVNDPTPNADGPSIWSRMDSLDATLRGALYTTAAPPPHLLADIHGQLAQLADAAERIEPAEAARCAARLQQVRDVYEQLVLRVTQQHAEAADQLIRMRKGKGAIRTYGDSV